MQQAAPIGVMETTFAESPSLLNGSVLEKLRKRMVR
jgi:hypothetical protein